VRQASAPRSLDAWIIRLRALRHAGHPDDAIRELERFRAEFPDADARLPDDVRQWVRGLR
jgi:hypothetical protein